MTDDETRQAATIGARERATLDGLRTQADASTAAGEVARLRAALAEMAAEAARLRDLLPAEAVVPCPACGAGITADLDDDAAYVVRRHSRRTTGIGLGEIVWCGGGLVTRRGAR